MNFSKNNYFIMNILTDFQNPDKIKKIRKSWLSGNPAVSPSHFVRGEYRPFLRSLTAFGHTKISTQILIYQLRYNIDTA